jgi:Zn-dependent metalloprotease
VVTAAPSPLSNAHVVGSAQALLSAAGSPAGEPVSAPTDLVLLAGARRESGSSRRIRPVVTSPHLAAQPGPGEVTMLTTAAASKTLSALASPLAAANPLESFISSVSTLINSVFTAISNAITNLLTAIGVIPRRNQSPTAVTDGITTAEDTPVSVTAATLVGNDSDPNSNVLTVTGVSTPAHGSAVLAGTTVTYMPNADFNGADSFTYTVSDGHGGTATGTVAVTVTAVNDAPAAVGSTATTAEDTPVSVSATTLVGNDSDVDGDALTVTGVSSPAHGSAVLVGDSVTYAPDADFNGADSFTYTVSDGHGGTATGTVAVTVTAVNDAPVAAGPLSGTGAEDSTITGTLAGSDIDSESLAYAVATQAAHGVVTVTGDSWKYVPDANYSGVDAFSYTVTDGSATSAPAVVTIVVAAVNDVPHVVGDSAVIAADAVAVITVLDNDSDADGDALTVSGVSAPGHGTATLSGDSITYTPAVDYIGGDTFTYTVDDGQGGTATATVNVIVTPAGDGTHPDDDGVLTLADLEGLVAQDVVAVSENNDGTIRVIDGSFSDDTVSSDADAAALINKLGTVLGADGAFAAAENIVAASTGAGVDETFYRLSQEVNGVPVVGSQVILVTDGGGTATGLFNYYVKGIRNVNTTPDIGLDQAIAVVQGALLGSVGEQVPPENESVFLASLTVSGELVIYALDKDVSPSLAWQLNAHTTSVSADLPYVSSTYYVYANGADAGTVLIGSSNVVDASVSPGLIYMNVTGTATNSSGNTGPAELPGHAVSVNLNDSTSIAFTNMSAVRNFYANVLGRISYDGQDAGIVITLVNGPWANAIWTVDYQQFAFGMRSEYALDVVGHEFTHAVISEILDAPTGLVYQGESGALNESYADILGSLIEGKVGDGRWIVGEDWNGGIRSLSDPSLYDQPEDYAARSNTGCTTEACDYGGVHTNSGIFNLAAYTMMTDPRTAGVSSDTWAHVYYNSIFRLSPTAKFVDARAAIISSSKALGFSGDQLQAVVDAFDSVGIYDNAQVRIVLRWGQTPSDLDSHLTGPAVTQDGSRFHTWYGGKTYYSADALVADLDYDDTTSYGPEATTIRIPTAGDYYFYVHDFSNRGSSESTALATSGVTVEVYTNDAQVHAAYIGDGVSGGTYWLVFELSVSESGNVQIIPINSYSYSTPTN